jgi:hypothetical protein
VFCKEQRPLAAAGRAQVEAFTGKRTEIVMSAFRIGTSDSSNALEIIPTCCESFTELFDPLQAKLPVGCCEVLVILLAEIGEVPFEDINCPCLEDPNLLL